MQGFSPAFTLPRLRGLFFVRGRPSSRGIPGPAGPNRITAANSSGTGRDHDTRDYSSFARPGPVAPSKKFIRKYYALARCTGSRACRLNAVRVTTDDTPGGAVHSLTITRPPDGQGLENDARGRSKAADTQRTGRRGPTRCGRPVNFRPIQKKLRGAIDFLCM